MKIHLKEDGHMDKLYSLNSEHMFYDATSVFSAVFYIFVQSYYYLAYNIFDTQTESVKYDISFNNNRSCYALLHKLLKIQCYINISTFKSNRNGMICKCKSQTRKTHHLNKPYSSILS